MKEGFTDKKYDGAMKWLGVAALTKAVETLDYVKKLHVHAVY